MTIGSNTNRQNEHNQDNSSNRFPSHGVPPRAKCAGPCHKTPAARAPPIPGSKGHICSKWAP